jgi:OOP family OmpA-OmpF porin
MSDKIQDFLDADADFICVTDRAGAKLEITYKGAHASRPADVIDVDEFVGVKSHRAKGKRLTTYDVATLRFIEPELPPEPEPSDDGDAGEIPDGLLSGGGKVSPLAGAGVTYKVNDALDLQARYRYMWDVADLHADNVRYKSNQSVATLEAVYHPFRTSYVAPAPAPVVEEAPAPAPQIVEKNFALNSDVLFAFGKDSLKAEGVQALNALYQQIVEFQPKDGNAVVVGYTDRIGSDAYNQKLSEARARTVANFLVSKGMAASKVAIEGRGEANPVTGTKCNGVNAKAQLISCLAPDRRVEVRVSGVQEVQK